MSNASILAKADKNNFNDRIFTPNHIVKDIMDWVKPKGHLLEPFFGDGAFHSEMIRLDGVTTNWLEIDLGFDFFEHNEKYDYIITNPPYSCFTKVLEHCFKLADNVVLLIPHNKLWTSDKRIDMIEEYGTWTYKRFKVPKEWPAKFPIGAYWFKRRK